MIVTYGYADSCSNKADRRSIPTEYLLCGGTIMRKRLLTTITLIVLIVSTFAANAFAASGSFGYGVSSRTHIGTIYNNSGHNTTVYAKAVPSSGYTLLELVNGSVPAQSDSGIYPINPVNPNYIHVPVLAGGIAKVYATPYNCNYTSGTAYYYYN